MSSSNYYGADEGSEVYKDNEDTVIRTNPAEKKRQDEQHQQNKQNKQKNQNRQKEKKKKKEVNFEDERRILRETITQTTTDSYGSLNSLSILSGVSKLIFGVLPFLIMGYVFFLIVRSFNDAVIASNASDSTMATFNNSTIGVEQIASFFPLFIIMTMGIIFIIFFTNFIRSDNRLI